MTQHTIFLVCPSLLGLVVIRDHQMHFRELVDTHIQDYVVRVSSIWPEKHTTHAQFANNCCDYLLHFILSHRCIQRMVCNLYDFESDSDGESLE